MAPNKFENNIRETLENRTMAPSKEAWSKLSIKLDEHNKNKTAKPYWWLGIAASLAGLLLVITQLGNNDVIEEKPTIVNVPVENEIKQVTPKVIVPIDKETKKEAEASTHKKQKVEYKTIINEKRDVLKPDLNVQKTVVAVTQKQEKQAITPQEEPINNSQEALSFEDQKIKDIVAKVNTLKADNEAVTDAEINALLLQAQQEIRLKNIINESTGVVDANALLEDVEADLDQSFRSKVFEAIKASFSSVKTAVAQRND